MCSPVAFAGPGVQTASGSSSSGQVYQWPDVESQGSQASGRSIRAACLRNSAELKCRTEMKITHVIVGLNVGGAELMLKRLVEGLNGKSGMQHSVISLTDLGVIGPKLEKSGVEVVALGMKGALGLPATFLRLRRALKRQSPDIVQTWMYHSDFLGGLAAKSVGIDQVVWNVRNTYLTGRGAFNLLFRKLCSLLSFYVPAEIIYVSHSAQREHLNSGYNAERGVVIGNGFDTGKYAFSKANRLQYRSESGLQEGNFAVFSVGRCASAKDHPTFIRAVCEAASINPAIKGVLVGRDIDLDNYSLTDSERNAFVVLGEREDVAGLLSAADLFCLHSVTEGFPNVLGEAMCVGLPCIVTRAGDAELILSDARYTVDTGDFAGLAKLMVQLARHDVISGEALGARNRERIKATYSLESVLHRYLSVYGNVISPACSPEKLDTL